MAEGAADSRRHLRSPRTRLEARPRRRTRWRIAPQGRTLAHGPGLTVDEVTLNAPASLTTGAAPVSTIARLTIAGEFGLRNLDPTVLVDGLAVGKGIGAANLSSVSVLLLDASTLRTGSVVTYRYGAGPVTTVGTLTLGAK